MTQLVLSLFPGIGLLDMAFEQEGFTVVRGPDVLWGGDVRRFHPPAGKFDGIIGGPPCQTFSPLANLVRAKGYEPRFGNLIPEFARVVGAARPEWFLMENVPQAPEPECAGYTTVAFVLDNCTLDSGDGLGEQQERKRRFVFGRRYPSVACDLRRWIQQAALLLPRTAGAVTQTHVDNSQGAKGRLPAVTGREGGVETSARTRQQAVLSDPHAVPVAIGGSGKRKPGARVPAVTGTDGGGALADRSRDRAVVWSPAPGQRRRTVAVTGAHSGAAGRPKGGHLVVYRWERMLELQGLPLDFLEHAPFTVDGKRKAVANGVPLSMGKALARAVLCALGLPLLEHQEQVS